MRRLILGLCAALAASWGLWWLGGDDQARVLAPAALTSATAPTLNGPWVVHREAVRPAVLRESAGLPAHGTDRRETGVDEAALANAREAAVLHAWHLARNGRGAEADAQLEAVLAEAPQFRPALTLHGLLQAEWSQSAPDAEDLASPARRLQPPTALSEESGMRMAAWLRAPARRHLLPGNLLQLGSGVHTVLAADLNESRLYVLHHDSHGVVLHADYYLSTGTRGSFKQNPGDQRTPIGIYSLLPPLPASQRPALAGHGAWPLSFPNRWDQWQGHLGSGIWVHGSAPGQYDGLPHSTNGCLALSNEDLDQIAPLLDQPGTVLLVADHLEWVTPAALAQRRASALQRLAVHGGAERRPQADDSLYAYPGDPALLLIRRDEGGASGRDEFWPAGALEPLSAVRTANRSVPAGTL